MRTSCVRQPTSITSNILLPGIKVSTTADDFVPVKSIQLRRSWYEYDGAGDHERIEAILKAEELQPALMVVTGTKPHQRAHLYFLNAQPVTDGDELRACTTAPEDLLTRRRENPSRVRLAGTISHQKASKRARGYVTEATTLHVKREASHYFEANGPATPLVFGIVEVALGGVLQDHYAQQRTIAESMIGR